MSAVLTTNCRMAGLEDSDNGKSFQEAKLKAMCLIVHFFLKEEMARVRDQQIFMSSGWWFGRIVTDYKEGN